MSRNTIARINLAAIRNNLSIVRAMAPQSVLACVVKADAYGHGLGNIIGELGEAEILAVATVGEAERCRAGGWSGRLLHLQGPSNAVELGQLCSLRTEMVIHHQNQIDLLVKASRKIAYRLWLKIDSGMHRLGFPATQAASIFHGLEAIRGPEPTVLMTHFASADESGNQMTRQQIELFDKVTEGLVAPVSMANSAAILNFPDSHRDIIRAGIMLYGGSPSQAVTAQSLGLKPVMTLICDLIAVNDCRRGETVGYGAAWRCPQDMKVGVAAIGYGDGYPRHARNGTPVLIRGRKAPLIGRVSMDMICIDLRGRDDVEIGDQVTLWGEGLAVEDIATWADTIPYELICSVTGRVKTVLTN